MVECLILFREWLAPGEDGGQGALWWQRKRRVGLSLWKVRTVFYTRNNSEVLYGYKRIFVIKLEIKLFSVNPQYFT